MLYYLASILLTALIEVGIILIVNGDERSSIHRILEDKSRTIGLALVLTGLGLVPIVNLFAAVVIIILWGMGEL